MSQPVGLDPVIHSEARLRIMTTLNSLGADAAITFPRIQDLLKVTPGNLSTHLNKLEAAGYVEITKTFKGRTPVTFIAMTDTGKTAYQTYVQQIQSLLTGSPAPGESAAQTKSTPAQEK